VVNNNDNKNGLVVCTSFFYIYIFSMEKKRLPAITLTQVEEAQHALVSELKDVLLVQEN